VREQLNNGSEQIAGSEFMNTHKRREYSLRVCDLPKLLEQRRLPGSPSTYHDKMVVPFHLHVLQVLCEGCQFLLTPDEHFGLLTGTWSKRIRTNGRG